MPRSLLPLAAYLPRRCIVAASRNADSDAAATADAFARCASDAEIVFPAGAEYRAYEPVVILWAMPPHRVSHL
ncbi:hypothetical protein LZ31DRAFT_590703 [Colletotrichum somersetense]|nr:hypothetical protein LZ31DRAFT_590703 [Colletotrichum somersetense]